MKAGLVRTLIGRKCRWAMPEVSPRLEVVDDGRTVGELVTTDKLNARYEAEGRTALELRSRRPKTSAERRRPRPSSWS